MSTTIKDLDYIADQLDTRFKGPMGFRFGWDAIIGLIPGLGDLVTSSFSFYIILRAAAMGTPASVLIRMGINVLIDNLFDKIPVLGLFFDFVWKSNQKNVQLLRAVHLDRQRTTWASRLFVFAILFVIFAFFVGVTIGGFYLLWWIFEYLRHGGRSGQWV